ncbi:MAG: iron ABC transporter permease [Thermoplasmatales archaeon]|nr:iron ABC transporter permease [Thermoplasmatales archaeon]
MIYISKKVLFITLFCILAALSVGLALSFGKYPIGFLESYEIFFDHIRGRVPEGEIAVTKDMIIWELRAPRVLMGLIAGAGLAACGVTMQSVMRNPLADPYTTGVSSGASLGAIIYLILGISLVPTLIGQNAAIANAFLLSLIPAGLIILISRFMKTTPAMMILIGVSVMFLFSAITSLIMLVSHPDQVAEAYSWTAGTLGRATWSNIPISAGIVSACCAIMMVYSGKLNLLSSGDKCARSLGLNPDGTRVVLLVIVSFATASIVAFTGTIGFIGLVAPHMVRIFVGSDNRYLMPASMAFGAFMLTAADCLAREAGTAGLPVGVVTAMIGGPLFLYLLVRKGKRT